MRTPTQASRAASASSRGKFILLDSCYSQLISVADDCMMKVFDVKNGKLKLQKQIELGEIVSVCTN